MQADIHIDFYFDNVDIEGFDKERILDQLMRVLREEGAEEGMIQYVFCDDDKMLAINQQYLNHDTLTDIITFGYHEELGGISGDIYISYPRVLENAENYGEERGKELLRVMIHGVLHLLGYEDQTAADKERMRAKENYYLSLQA
ncbi:MAG: rRNA maturation RNase YbeY [Bacteroidales bacterium]|nr:rRNA maturation RNase YbeY [Bacteroidales bacterium]